MTFLCGGSSAIDVPLAEPLFPLFTCRFKVSKMKKSVRSGKKLIGCYKHPTSLLTCLSDDLIPLCSEIQNCYKQETLSKQIGCTHPLSFDYVSRSCLKKTGYICAEVQSFCFITGLKKKEIVIAWEKITSFIGKNWTRSASKLGRVTYVMEGLGG